MNKKTKWGIIILVGTGIIGGGIYSQLPKKNDELTAADKIMSGKSKKGRQVLNVNAKIIKPQSLTDEFTTTGVLLPDEEVDLSFETSGKIVEINFEEGTSVKKGQLLAKRPTVAGTTTTPRLTVETGRRPCIPSRRIAEARCCQ